MKRNLSDQCSDVVVIGGGFYGCCLAIFLSDFYPDVILVEKGQDLLTRASYNNQARAHGGYHYPRSFLTALRSFINLPRFCLDFRDCIENRFEKVYAIARSLSQVNAFQFRKFCSRIRASIRPAPKSIRRLFNEGLIEEVFCVQEYAFDALRLRRILKQRLQEHGVQVRLGTTVEMVSPGGENLIELTLGDGSSLVGRHVLNCTYANINTLLKRSGLPILPMKHEVTEMALIEAPDELKNLGITVMDGPFFSTMPFPPLKVHSLSHVRYTPHESWLDQEAYKPAYEYLEGLRIRSNHVLMLKDAQRYLPVMAKARYLQSLYEIKTVLKDNEIDDGRPILMRKIPPLNNMTTIMGGKIDNIYDVLLALTNLNEYSRELGKMDPHRLQVSLERG
jgi:glycine/D-amino acid oxidase-like deaminating enzyme